MKNNTRTAVTFGGALFNRLVAKQDRCHSTGPADKQINSQPPQ